METLQVNTRFAVMAGPRSPRLPSHEELFRREYDFNRANSSTPRTPRRSQTVYDYQLPAGLPGGWTTMPSNYTTQARDHHPAADRIPSPIVESFPTAEAGDSDSMSHTTDSSDRKSKVVSPSDAETRQRRPPLPPPRRSYSVMDYEPMPHMHRPSEKLMLMDLPSEVHFSILDFLDPIDGTCLGLTNKHFYAIHRRMHGSVPLSTRRAGPNDMEWAWHLAGTVVHANSSLASADPAAAAAAAAAAVAAAAAAGGETENKALEKKALAMLRVRGHAYCRKCGISRCELHKHIQEWMGDSYEYCSVRQKFGPKAPEGAKSFCYLSNPKKPGRCGRHRVAKAQPTVISPV